MANHFVRKLLRECKKLGIPVSIIESNPSADEEARLKQIKTAVRRYVVKIEEGHKQAATSKLLFKDRAD